MTPQLDSLYNQINKVGLDSLINEVMVDTSGSKLNNIKNIVLNDKYLKKTADYEVGDASSYSPKVWFDVDSTFGVPFEKNATTGFGKVIEFGRRDANKFYQPFNEEEAYLNFIKDWGDTENAVSKKYSTMVEDFNKEDPSKKRDTWWDIPEEVRYILTDMGYNQGPSKFIEFPDFIKSISEKEYTKASNDLKYINHTDPTNRNFKKFSNYWDDVGAGEFGLDFLSPGKIRKTRNSNIIQNISDNRGWSHWSSLINEQKKYNNNMTRTLRRHAPGLFYQP